MRRTDAPPHLAYSIARKVLLCIVLGSVFLFPAQAQEPPLRNEAVAVFIDCNRCDRSFFRREITFVNHVRDRQQADVHVLITDQRTGSGGRRFTLNFIGRERFDELDYELTYTSPENNTEDEERTGLSETIKLGLTPYAARTPLAEQLSVSYTEREETSERQDVDDPWNNWVFEIEGGGGFGKESSQSEYSIEGELSADRVTEMWRIRNEFNFEYEEENFERDDETITSISRSTNAESSAVRSLSPHWSVGLFGDAFSSTFRNMHLGFRATPALEYNVFPYAESNRREFTFTYRIGGRSVDYREETIFNETSETLLDQSLRVGLRLEQPWGFVFASVEGSHFFHDVSKNRLELDSFVSVRLIEGLSLRVSWDVEVINDQLHLPKGDATLEEVLLRRRELATSFEVSGSVSLAYTFGSIYNNIVNDRL